MADTNAAEDCSTVTPDRQQSVPTTRGSVRRENTPISANRPSPYRMRPRTPSGTPTLSTPVAADRSRVSRLDRSLSAAASPSASANSLRPSPDDLFQLVVQPVVKTTLSQKDTTATRLDPYIATGGSFDEILHKVWEKYRSHIEGKAIKGPTGWTCENEVFISDWKRFFQLRSGRHSVEGGRNEQGWNTWLTATRNEAVKLIIYKYGDAIRKKDDQDQFLETCIRPLTRDRAGATAEEELQATIRQLQTNWEATFQAPAAVWRMWGNHITRNLNRSTWPSAITEDPPDNIAHLLRPANLPSEERLDRICHSANLALECVDGAIDDYARLRDGWTALGRQLDMYERRLAARKRCVEAAIRDARPPPRDRVIDPLISMENVDDVDHEE